jgi:hypothetical protein
VWLIIAARLPNREPIRVYPEAELAAAINKEKEAVRKIEERKAAQKNRRKLRKKLR